LAGFADDCQKRAHSGPIGAIVPSFAPVAGNPNMELSTTPPLQHPAETHARLVTPVVLLFILAGLAIATILFAVMRDQDRAAIAQSEAVVQALLRRSQGDLAALAKDYGYWNDAVRKLVVALDPTWADENVGVYLGRIYKLTATLVVSGEDRLTYAVVDRVRADPAAAAAALPALAPILDRARRQLDVDEPSPSFGVIKLGDRIHFVGASRIAPERPGSLVIPDPRAVLVLLCSLEDNLLAFMRGGLAYENVRVEPAAAGGLDAAIALGEEPGPFAYAVWRPRLPSDELQILLLPMIAVAIAVMAGLVALLLTRIDRTIGEIRSWPTRAGR
jgi:sensor domain CHASE-containing protein